MTHRRRRLCDDFRNRKLPDEIVCERRRNPSFLMEGRREPALPVHSQRRCRWVPLSLHPLYLADDHLEVHPEWRTDHRCPAGGDRPVSQVDVVFVARQLAGTSRRGAFPRMHRTVTEDVFRGGHLRACVVRRLDHRRGPGVPDRGESPPTACRDNFAE